MEFSRSSIKNRFIKPSFLSRETIEKSLNRKSVKNRISPKFEALERRSTVIDNEKISQTLNSEILLHKLQPFNYQRAESELRNILRNPSKSKEKYEGLRKKSSFNRLSRVLKPNFRINEISYWAKDHNQMNLPYLTNSKKLKGILRDNTKEPQQKDVDLIPISVKLKNNPLISRKTPLKRSPKGKNYLKNELDNTCIFALDNSQSPSPDIIKHLKDSSNLVSDWKKSILYHNIKHNRGSPELFDGYYKKELEDLALKLSDEYDLRVVIDKLFYTLEKLLIQLLGSKNDLDQVKVLFGKASLENAKFLIDKCLILYKFRDKTSLIIENILKLEILAREDDLERNLYQMIGLMRIIQKKIKSWRKDESSPFFEFVFDGENYLEKVNRDLFKLQSLALSKEMERCE